MTSAWPDRPSSTAVLMPFPPDDGTSLRRWRTRRSTLRSTATAWGPAGPSGYRARNHTSGVSPEPRIKAAVYSLTADGSIGGPPWADLSGQDRVLDSTEMLPFGLLG